MAGAGSRTYPGVNAFFGGLAGAGPGALVGAMVPIFQLVFHGGGKTYLPAIDNSVGGGSCQSPRFAYDFGGATTLVWS